MSAVKFDPEAIRALAQILRDTDLTEIELVEKDSRLRVVRTPPAVMAPPPMGWAAAPAAAAPVAVAPATAQAEAVPDVTKHPGVVTSPMVGVAYLSPEPGQPPFVAVGAKVVQGQTLLLIEAMKTFNQIRAPKAGTVTRILIETGMPVEYGEPLLIIE
ncbi:acetyl-CoA carboxylase, biotin carboxyl carrier protein [Siccirubricoccus deserti]|uniref:Biotin carboxyl carrier protein of acetyl-CoA carboxylase n=1 Tax=Siccirubricoccus deserti TaxID=2013562 RepID=A0A9X0QVW2_9PROT|nr:acetyl-CoA carboxylase biotin carboxyl carrier protein [Siccirubricoccus deserti]MBC4014809.1 acetyl-CoA carboxylase biotin carboxyl carrier protein [Siccirubricoccus deserti]GGC35199.1 acetyl-CoA carboxylase, biotin carboxyl carrier protein [Siccirubricoccus deserti]